MLQITPETKIPTAAEFTKTLRNGKKILGGVSFAEYRQIVRPDMTTSPPTLQSASC
jgi:hypothetical protein